MERKDNYAIQARDAKNRFLGYDQEKLIQKYGLKYDEEYLYTAMLSQPYRLHRKTGDMDKLADGLWQDANSFGEVMTLLDMLCDARDDRSVSGKWKSMQSFGLMFHRNLLEERRDPNADHFDRHPEQFHKGCLALGGKPVPGCDMGYGVELFDGLPVAVQFWHGDEEFFPRIRYLWDENALQYIRYETMHYAIPLVIRAIRNAGK